MLKPNLPLNPTFKNGPHAKGQLISKGLFDVIVWTKEQTIFF